MNIVIKNTVIIDGKVCHNDDDQPSYGIIFGVGAMTDQRVAVGGTPAKRCKPRGRVMLVLDMPATKRTTLSPVFTDAKGNVVEAPTGITGIEYSVDNPAVVGAFTQPDGTCLIVGGNVGDANVGVVVHTDTGDLMGAAVIHVTPGPIARVELVNGPLEDQPPINIMTNFKKSK